MSAFNLKSPELVSEKRMKELAVLARRSRNRWFSSAVDSKLPRSNPNQPANEVAQSVQGVLDYFRELIGDDEIVDVDDLLLPDDDDEFSDQRQVPIPTYEDGVDPYWVFLKKMQHPAAADLAIQLQKNVRRLRSVVLSTEDHAKVTDAIFSFLSRFEQELRENELWASENQAQFQHTSESLESFVFVKLYDVLFPSSDSSRQRDHTLRERLKLLKFLTWEHLDIRSMQGVGCEVLAEPVAALREINMHKSPHAKVNCLKRMSKEMTKVLRAYRTDGSLPGADDFLPALILTVKEANPEHFRSNLDYMLRCVHPSKLMSEAGYLITHIDSALHFLETLESSSLTMSQNDFEKCVQICRAELEKENQALAAKEQQAASQAAAGQDKKLSREQQQHLRTWVKQMQSSLQPPGTLDTYQEVSIQSIHNWRRSANPPAEPQPLPLPPVSRASTPTSAAIDVDMHGLYEALSAARRDLARVHAVGENPRQTAQNQLLEIAYRRSETVLERSLGLQFVNANAEGLCVSDINRLLAEYQMLFRLNAALLGRVAASPLALRSDMALHRSASRSTNELAALGSPHAASYRPSPVDGASSINDTDSLAEDNADDNGPGVGSRHHQHTSSKDVSLFGPDYTPDSNGHRPRVLSTKILKTGSGSLF